MMAAQAVKRDRERYMVMGAGGTMPDKLRRAVVGLGDQIANAVELLG
jgi:hypothetical protein